jgi:hypothetical protein
MCRWGDVLLSYIEDIEGIGRMCEQYMLVDRTGLDVLVRLDT